MARICRKVQKYMEELLKPYSEETRRRFAVEHGNKHDRLLLDGKVLMVLSRNPQGDGWHGRNARALLRRSP